MNQTRKKVCEIHCCYFLETLNNGPGAISSWIKLFTPINQSIELPHQHSDDEITNNLPLFSFPL